jgi:hypothetical protein
VYSPKPIKHRLYFWLIAAMLLPFWCRAQSQSQFQKTGDDSKTVKRKGQNLVAYDDRFLHYGFFLAINKSQFRVSTSSYFREQQQDTSKISDGSAIMVMNSVPSLGFTTGFILNFRILDLLDFRMLPTVSFYQRYIEFENLLDVRNVELKQSTFSFIELPLLFKFKSQRRNNSRMYMLAGIKPALEVGSKKNEIQNDRLRSNIFDFNIEYGCGFDMYYPLFKFSPEIRFSHGFVNLRLNDPNEYARSIKSMLTHTVTMYFHFE